MARKAKEWPIEEMKAMYLSGMTMPEVAVAISSPEWQKYWLKNLGHEYRPHKVLVNQVLRQAGCPIRAKGAQGIGRHPKMKPWPLPEMLEWYQSGMTLQAISDRLCSAEWQPYWIAKTGKEYRPHQKIVNKLLKKRIKLRGHGSPGAKNGSWRGGRHVDKGGYILVHQPDHPMATKAGYVREHRLIAERFLGRYLTETEVCHHRDENPGNNDPENILVYETNAKHISETTKGRTLPQQSTAMKRRFALAGSPSLLASHDELLGRLHSHHKLSIRQICGLLIYHPATVSRHLTRIGFATRQTIAGTVTDQIREECHKFVAILDRSKADGQE